jgi:hypothetical protein
MSGIRSRREVFRAVLGALAASAAGLSSRADDGPATITARDALARLKSLAGTWTGTAGGGPATVRYRLTGGGSAVVEELFPGTEHEMMSVYHLDGDDLRMTHYCAAGNQPRMKLDRAASSPGALVFAFDGGSNLDPAKDAHMHEGRLVLLDAKHIEAHWTGWNDGRPGGAHVFKLNRE